MFKIDETRLELFIEKFYNDTIHNNEETLIINHQLLDQYYCDLIDELNDEYQTIIPQMERIITNRRIQATKTKVKFKNVRPVLPINELHQKYNRKLVCFEGLVKKRSRVANQIVNISWECRECGHNKTYKLKYGQQVKPPRDKCPACGSGRGWDKNEHGTKYKDIQLVTIQEPLDKIRSGFQPAEIQVCFEDDMINKVKPGDLVNINGVLELRNKRSENFFTEYVTAEYVEQLQQDFEEVIITPHERDEIIELSRKDNLFDVISESIIPSLHGNKELKEALALYLFSCDSNKDDETGVYTRGDIHLLMVGDPGVGKSQILKYVSNLAPRGVYTSGKGSSGAGLTATAVKDELGSWSLEAGAMVLADKGNICIDEFDKMREEDRSAIHEALEQQTISISKAGITTTLNSRCSVLAAANPKNGNFNPMKNFKEQVTLSVPILSRFDLIFMLEDVPDEERDSDIALSILLGANETVDRISFDLFRKYISYARREIHPEMTKEVAYRLTEYFVQWRKLASLNENPIPITPRQLEAMYRLTMASARARLSSKVSLEDAERAIRLQDFCIRRVGFDVETATTSASVAVGYGGLTEEKKDEKMMEIFDSTVNQYGDEYGKVSLNLLLKEFAAKDINKGESKSWLRQQAKNDLLLAEDNATMWSKI